MNNPSLLGLVLAAFLPTMPAAGVVLRIPDRAHPSAVTVLDARYEVDEKVGHVQLAIDHFDGPFETGHYSDPIQVPGLAFDRDRHEVVYRNGGEAVTCAIRKKVLWATTYAATGACQIVATNATAAADDGRAITAPSRGSHH